MQDKEASVQDILYKFVKQIEKANESKMLKFIIPAYNKLFIFDVHIYIYVCKYNTTFTYAVDNSNDMLYANPTLYPCGEYMYVCESGVLSAARGKRHGFVKSLVYPRMP